MTTSRVAFLYFDFDSAGECWRWKESDSIGSLEDGQLCFVNREKSIDKLIGVHRKIYGKSTYKGAGPLWELPIVDNIFGMGKTTFAQHYIQQCKRVLSDASEGFELDICGCHTVTIQMSQGDLAIEEDKMDHFMYQLLKYEMQSHFSGTPKALGKNYLKSSHFLGTLIGEVGPIFLVLDEIGVAFATSGMDEYAQ